MYLQNLGSKINSVRFLKLRLFRVCLYVYVREKNCTYVEYKINVNKLIRNQKGYNMNKYLNKIGMIERIQIF